MFDGLRPDHSFVVVPPKRASTPIGSFADAELENFRRIAALTPAQRVKMVCSMHGIVRRVEQARNAKDGGPVEPSIRRAIDRP